MLLLGSGLRFAESLDGPLAEFAFLPHLLFRQLPDGAIPILHLNAAILLQNRQPIALRLDAHPLRDVDQHRESVASAPRQLIATSGAARVVAAVVAVLARLPFTMDRMWDHDSIQFAVGVEKYDLAAHHPHPPGYPLFIGILKILAALGVDPLHGMVGLAILGGAIGTGGMVLLAARLAPEEARLRTGPRIGLFAAALYAFDPLLWFYGELPLIYAGIGKHERIERADRAADSLTLSGPDVVLDVERLAVLHPLPGRLQTRAATAFPSRIRAVTGCILPG